MPPGRGMPWLGAYGLLPGREGAWRPLGRPPAAGRGAGAGAGAGRGAGVAPDRGASGCRTSGWGASDAVLDAVSSCSGAGAGAGAGTASAAAGRGAGAGAAVVVEAGLGAAGPAGLEAGADAGAGAGAGASAGKASRRRRTTGASTVEEADFTNSPSSLSLASTVLLSTPSSLASSWTRNFATNSPVSVRSGTGTDHQMCWQLIAGYSSGAHQLPTLFLGHGLHGPVCVAAISWPATSSSENRPRRARSHARRRRAFSRQSLLGCSHAPRPGIAARVSTTTRSPRATRRTRFDLESRSWHPTQVRTGGTGAASSVASRPPLRRTGIPGLLRVVAHTVLLLGGVRVDVDAPPGEAGREASVLALLADRERQLVVGHHHPGSP